MNNNKRFLLIGCIAVPIILIVAFWIGYSMTAGMAGPRKTVAKNSWLIVDPSGMVADYNELQTNDFWDWGQPSVEDICRKIRYAAKDSKIKGILLEPSFVQASYSAIGEIELALQDFRKSGKPVIAHLPMAGQKDYYLCLAASKIAMEPSASAGLMLEGVSANIMFYKEMLDKIGVTMHVMQSGEFKGAGEPYSQTSLSEGTKENLMLALKGRYDYLIQALERSRKLEPGKAQEIFEQRPDFFINASYALENKLIDQLAGRDSLLASYQITKHNSVRIKDYKDVQPTLGSKDRIAIVNLNGQIGPSSGYAADGTISAAKVQRIVEAIERDSKVKAIVLRVNSPGGSALESELIYQKLMRLKAGMPIVVSMTGVAASGGYYISCASDYIYADPLAITGSIGVIMMIPEATGLSRKIGLRSQSIGYGKFSGAFDPLNAYDPEFLASLRRNSTSVYDEFKSRVMQARGYSPEEIALVAEGRVFCATDAKANRLIDEIGGLKEAIAKSAGLAKLSSYEIKNYPTKISIYELFMESKSFPMMLSRLTKRQSFDPEELAREFLSRISTREWLYYLPYKMD